MAIICTAGCSRVVTPYTFLASFTCRGGVGRRGAGLAPGRVGGGGGNVMVGWTWERVELAGAAELAGGGRCECGGGGVWGCRAGRGRGGLTSPVCTAPAASVQRVQSQLHEMPVGMCLLHHSVSPVVLAAHTHSHSRRLFQLISLLPDLRNSPQVSCGDAHSMRPPPQQTATHTSGPLSQLCLQQRWL